MYVINLLLYSIVVDCDCAFLWHLCNKARCCDSRFKCDYVPFHLDYLIQNGCKLASAYILRQLALYISHLLLNIV